MFGTPAIDRGPGPVTAGASVGAVKRRRQVRCEAHHSHTSSGGAEGSGGGPSSALAEEDASKLPRVLPRLINWASFASLTLIF